jgi:hypothetical protein
MNMTRSTSGGGHAENKLWAVENYLDELERSFLRDARANLSQVQAAVTPTVGGPALLAARGNLRGARALIDEQLRLIDEVFAISGLDPDHDVRPLDPPTIVD